MGNDAGAQFDEGADWTRGPAKWGAVVVLGAASIWGMVWSMGRVLRADAVVMGGNALGGDGVADEIAGAGPEAAVKESLSAPEASASAKAVARDAAALTTKININTATQAELELLPGIGPALAGRVLEYRAANGAFKAVDELDRVKGIGPKLLEKLRGRVVVE